MKKGLATIKDIARELNVSPSTVSRALKDHPDISDTTKASVKMMAKKLNYQPNAVALSLQSRRSNTIGVIIPEIVHYFFSSVISGIEDVAYKAGFNVIICQSNERYDREVANVNTLMAYRVDGILVSVSKGTVDFSHFQKIKDNGIPLVFYDRIVPGLNVDQVIIDDFDAAYQATRHLIKNGRRKIAHFAGPQNLIIGEKRKEGYIKALNDFGVYYDNSLVRVADNLEKASDAIENILKKKVNIDGIFAVNDQAAVGAMQALIKNGIKIPEEVAVVGFSDGVLATITNPKLTSVVQHGYDMGQTATNILLNRIYSDNNCKYRTEVLKTELVIRESSVVKEDDFF